MNWHFHRNLNRMALFTAFVIAGVIMFHVDFMRIASANIWLNGVIIGATFFGMGLCFVDIFKLLPEYRWIRRYFHGRQKNAPLPPRILRPVAMIMNGQGHTKPISASTLRSFLEIIIGRFEDQREAIRYITNTLIFLGLLGTFWGLINTVGGFADLITGMNFDDVEIMTKMQAGLAKPLSGMSIAFTSSLFGLAGSLVVGFLGLQVQMAQNAIFRELEEELSDRARIFETDEIIETIPQVNLVTKELTKAVKSLERTVAKMN